MTTVRLAQPPGIVAGFHAVPDRPGTLAHAGENWASGSLVIRPHAHPVWEVYVQVHGTTRWRAGTAAVDLAPGDVLAVPPRVEHAMVEAPGTRHHYLYAALDLPAFPGPVGAPWTRSRVVHAPGGAVLEAPLRQVVRELSLRQALQAEGLEAAVAMLAVELTRLLGSAERPVPVLAPHPGVARVRALLDTEPQRPWRVDAMAAVAGLSRGHLATLFTREVGLAPHRYLQERRLARARELLLTSDLPVTAVGLATGFASGPHFSRAFRAATGCSPGEWRRRSSAPSG